MTADQAEGLDGRRKNDAEPTAEEWVQRHGNLFLQQYASVAIAGIDVLRSTILLTKKTEDEPEFNWRIAGWPSGEERTPFVLMGDLLAKREGWFVGVSVIAHLTFEDPLEIDPNDAAQINRTSAALGAWCTNVLYDLAAIIARQIVAANGGCSVVIPRLTPTTEFGEIEVVEKDLAENASE